MGYRNVIIRLYLFWILHGTTQAHGLITVQSNLQKKRQGHVIRLMNKEPRKSCGAIHCRDDSTPTSNLCLHHDSTGPPYLALVTEPDACDTPDRIESTFEAVHAAVSTSEVALVSVRVVRPSHLQKEEFTERLIDLTRRLVVLTNQFSFRVVVSSDWIDAALKAPAHGVHVKESHRSLIPNIRQQLGSNCIIGTSAHSVASAVEAWSKYHPNYLFVGTCYATASHPEKTDLEGPQLPGKVCLSLDDVCTPHIRPIVMAIGGIDARNCYEPVVIHGADGIATIRAVLQARDPASEVRLLRINMQKEK